MGLNARCYSLLIILLSVLLRLQPALSAEQKKPEAAAGQAQQAVARLVQTLLALPSRWSALGPHKIADSSKSAEELVEAASSEERKRVGQRIVELLHTPADQRALLIARRTSPITELELWWPALSVPDLLAKQSTELAASLLEVWLLLAEKAGRRDVVLRAASLGLQLVRVRLTTKEALHVTEPWVALPFDVDDTQSQRGGAEIIDEHADMLRGLGKYAEALAAHRKARAIFAANGLQVMVANTWDGEAEDLVRLERFPEAMNAYRHARRLYEQKDTKLGLANAWFGEAEILRFMRQSRAALAAYQTARGLYEKVGSRRGQGSTWRGEANILFEITRYEESLAAQRTARTFFRQIQDPVGEANTWRGEAEVLHRLSRLPEALAAYQSARSLFQERDSLHGLAEAYYGEGKVLFALGRTGQALKAERMARDLFGQTRSSLGLANTWEAEGAILHLLGRIPESIEAYQTARQVFHTVSPTGEANAWQGEGRGLYQLERFPDSLVAHRKARSIFHRIGDKQGEANTWKGEGEVALMSHRYELAIRAFRIARTFFIQARDATGISYSWDGEATALLMSGRLQQAAAAAERALQTMKQQGTVSSPLAAHLTLLHCYLQLNKKEAAVGHAMAALPLIKRNRQRGITEEDRTSLINWSLPYDVLVPHYAEQTDKHVEALRLAEAAHAPVLRDLLFGERPEEILLPDDGQLAKVYKALAELDQRFGATREPEEQSALRQQSRSLQAQLRSLHLQSQVAALDEVTDSIDDAQRVALTAAVGPILLFYSAPERAVAFLLLPGQPEPVVRFIARSREELEALTRDLRSRLATPRLQTQPETVEQLRAAYHLLIGPFAQELVPYQGKHLVLVPHGPLHQLPFESLLGADQKTLNESFAVSFSPSLSALHRLRQRPALRNQLPFVALAAGTGLDIPLADLEQLKAIYKDPAAVAQVNASYDDYQRLAPKAEYLLLNTHGYHVHNDREETYLELTPSPDGSHDRKLRASEIAALRLNARLVILAACETAKGEALLSDERLDLSRAFLTAGARAVLATRWKIPAGAQTQALLFDLHRLLVQGEAGQRLRVDVALAKARQLSQGRGASAALWAAFILIGDPE